MILFAIFILDLSGRGFNLIYYLTGVLWQVGLLQCVSADRSSISACECNSFMMISSEVIFQFYESINLQTTILWNTDIQMYLQTLSFFLNSEWFEQNCKLDKHYYYYYRNNRIVCSPLHPGKMEAGYGSVKPEGYHLRKLNIIYIALIPWPLKIYFQSDLLKS